jgi:hypothetical protein
MSKVVEIAKKEIGQGEVPLNSNKTKYGKWFGFDGVAWCGMFVSWCYDQAGTPLGNIGFKKGFAGCQTAVAHYRKTNRITTNPVAGNIVFFDWNKDGRHDHTGIFVRWIELNKTFESIEGNTAVGNDSNGGNVMLRTRKNINVLFVDPF